jgi:phage baseplate assembly protein V
MNDLAYRVSELERRLANVLRIGVIESVDHANYRATVKIGNLLTAPLRWTVERAGDDRSWWAPSVGEQVQVLSSNGDLHLGVISRSLYSADYLPPTVDPDIHQTRFSDGAVFEYNKSAHQGRFSVGATSVTANQTAITIASNGSTIVVDGTGVAINGNRIDLN